MPYGNVDLGQQWLLALLHQAITQPGVDFLLVSFSGFYLRTPAIMLYDQFENHTFKIIAKSPTGQWTEFSHPQPSCATLKAMVMNSKQSVHPFRMDGH